MNKLSQNITNDKVVPDSQDNQTEPETSSQTREIMKKLDEFFSCFFDDDETIHLRFLKPKNEKKKLPAKNATVTRRELREDPQSVTDMLKFNKKYGVYFTVNAGGTKKEEISRYTAVFCEDDERTIEEQLGRFKPFKPSVLVKTRRSVHAYWLLKSGVLQEDWTKSQNFLINFFGTDAAVKDVSRVMRVPFFNHLQIEGGKLVERQIELLACNPDLRYSISEFQEIFEEEVFEEIKDYFTEAQDSGNGFIALCPAHDDHNPSLQISKGDIRNVVIKCFAGCEIEQILAAANLPPHLRDFIYSEKGEIKTVNKTLKMRTAKEKTKLQFAPLKPLDSTLKPVEKIDIDCLPKVLTNWLVPASKVIGCPLDFLVLSSIVITGNLEQISSKC